MVGWVAGVVNISGFLRALAAGVFPDVSATVTITF